MSEVRVCIKCQEKMLPEMVQKVEVDICPGCGGMWLDKDEIRELSQKSNAELAKLRSILDGVRREDHFPDSTVEVPCPACQGKLTLANLGPIFVEHCPVCDGLYLDKGEMEKAIKVLKVRGDEIATIVALARYVVTSGEIGE